MSWSSITNIISSFYKILLSYFGFETSFAGLFFLYLVNYVLSAVILLSLFF